MPGAWILRAEDIKELTPQQIQGRFQLKLLPTKISRVKVPSGTQLRVGTVNPDQHSRGGDVVQFEIKSNFEPGWFSETEDLGEWLIRNSK